MMASTIRKLLAVACLFGMLASAADARRICPILCGGKQSVLWTPLNLGSVLVAWWDAQDTTHITFNGSNVSAWTDKKGGVVASQATGASQPGWSATARNGKPGLTFSGSQFLTFTPSASFPTGTAALLGTMVVAAQSSQTNPASQAFGFVYGPAATTAGQSSYSYQDTTGAVSYGSSGPGNAVSAESWNAQDRLQVVTWGATAVAQNIDGLATENFTVAAVNTQAAIGSIGEWTLFGSHWVGAGQQYIVITGGISTNKRQCIEGWESWYDGKAGSNLPSGHPYKAAPPTTVSNCS